MAYTRIPPRLKVIRALRDTLKGINPDNDYEFDLRDTPEGLERVVIGRLTIGNDEPLPMVTIVEPSMGVAGISTAKQPDNTTRAGEWDLVIQGFTRGSKNDVTDTGYQLEAEVRRCLASQLKKPASRPGNMLGLNIFGLGNTVFKMEIGSPVVRPNEHISEQAVFYLVLTLHIVEDMTEVPV